MSCPKCEKIVERPDLPHILRQCEGCGREIRIYEAGRHGIGIKVRKGDKFVIPKDWFKVSLNPLKSTTRLSRPGVMWFAELINFEDLPKRKNEVLAEIDRLETQCDKILSGSSILAGLDFSDADQAKEIVSKLKERKDSSEWWAFLMVAFINFVREAIEKNDVQEAIWAMGCAERCRSMLLFKEHLEEVVWIGQSAKRIVDILRTWDNNKTNADEGFWQITFRENVYAISQVFAVPLIFIQQSAYVGGMNIDRKNPKFVDYVFSQESSREAVLVEIKTPATKLLGGQYRGLYSPSRYLSGAIVQVMNYRRELLRNLGTLVEGTNHKLSAFAPKCVVIIGNGGTELDSDLKRHSFELFRSNSKDVEIVTYDELFRKLEVLASLFNLTRAS